MRSRNRRQSSGCQAMSVGTGLPQPSSSRPSDHAVSMSGRWVAYPSNSPASRRLTAYRRARRWVTAGSAAGGSAVTGSAVDGWAVDGWAVDGSGRSTGGRSTGGPDTPGGWQGRGTRVRWSTRRSPPAAARRRCRAPTDPRRIGRPPPRSTLPVTGIARPRKSRRGARHGPPGGARAVASTSVPLPLRAPRRPPRPAHPPVDPRAGRPARRRGCRPVRPGAGAASPRPRRTGPERRVRADGTTSRPAVVVSLPPVHPDS